MPDDDLFSSQLATRNSQPQPVECLGITFESDEARRAYFIEKLRERLRDPEFRKIEGFPIGTDEDILAMSDPPYYTACPNPFVRDFIAHWSAEKRGLRTEQETSDTQSSALSPQSYHREPLAVDVSEGKTDPIYKAHSYHTKVPHKAIVRAIVHYTNPGDIVLDGFCGSGMTGVAAQVCAHPDPEGQAPQGDPPGGGPRGLQALLAEPGLPYHHRRGPTHLGEHPPRGPETVDVVRPSDDENGGGVMQIRVEDYPSLYQGADAASASAQRTYFRLQGVQLCSLILSGIIGASTPLVTVDVASWVYTSLAIILALGLLATWITRFRQDDKAWFDCRAISESVRTATWRFMMCAPPFQDNKSLEGGFIAVLKEIREARPDCPKRLAGVASASAGPITEFMRQVRDLPFEDRKTFYIESRLRDQKTWYTNKATLNARRAARWFSVTAILQLVAVGVAIIQAAIGSLGFGLVPVLTTCAAVVSAWSQMKRHDELTTTYTLAAQELGELEALASTVMSESDFPQIVEQTEEAISREHTMWCARRDILLRTTRSQGR